MDKVIVTTLLIIAAITSMVIVTDAVLPAIGSSAGAVSTVAGKMDDRIKSQISIIHVTSELDSNGNWVDSNGDGKFDVYIWVKNVGASRIVALDESDLFFGTQNNFGRIPYQTYADGQYPYWQYQIENGSEWTTSITLMVNIKYQAPLSQGSYLLKFIIPNGVSDDDNVTL